MGVGGQGHAPDALHMGKTRYTLYRSLGGLQSMVWTGGEKSRPHRDLIPGPSSPQLDAIPTELLGPRNCRVSLY